MTGVGLACGYGGDRRDPVGHRADVKREAQRVLILL